MRIAIVNDNLVTLEAIRHALKDVPAYHIAWAAADGLQAVQKALMDRPDLVLMDLSMPVLDGMEATRRIIQETGCTVLIVTESVDAEAARVLTAIGHGAVDAVDAPVRGHDGHWRGTEELLRKVATAAKLMGKQAPRVGSRPLPQLSLPAPTLAAAGAQAPPLLAIGASTGGPQALAEILSRLPKDFDASVLIVQHVEARFAAGLASWLNERTSLSVRTALEGSEPQTGIAWLAATDHHMVLTKELRLHYTPHPKACPYRPSVDAFFKSLAQNWPQAAFAVLLTGMGRDGAEGLLELRRKGWHTIVQDKESSVIYGMPKAAMELGAATEILSIELIGPSVAKYLRK